VPFPPSPPPPQKWEGKELNRFLNTPAILLRLKEKEGKPRLVQGVNPFHKTCLKTAEEDKGDDPPFITGLKDVFTGESLIIWGLGAGTTTACYPADDDIREYVINNSPLGGACQDISDWGERVAVFSFVPFLVIGGCGGKPRELSTAYALIEAHIVACLITQGLKIGVGRRRPDGGLNSFPSGHTSASFTFASVIAESYGLKGGIPAYILASLVALSRIELNKHHPSDVIFGATIGIVVGRAFARANINKNKDKKSTLILPYSSQGKTGVAILFSF
jgi:acid phosphatase family membrane protein YuiD